VAQAPGDEPTFVGATLVVLARHFASALLDLKAIHPD
jgi:hypothetical protein